jgi:hypothetical protein
VAAGDHDGGDILVQTKEGDGGRRDFSAINGAIPQAFGGATDGLYNAVCAGSKIACNADYRPSLRQMLTTRQATTATPNGLL